MPGAVHGELHRFLSETRLALVELPRDHGKTAQVCGRLVWELGARPGLRVKLVCSTDDLAEQRGRFVRDAVASNTRVRLVFPELRPSKPWGAGAFTVARPASVVGPSFQAFGVGAASTGTRADLLVCDDIVDARSLSSRSERERVRAYFHDNLLNLLEPGGRVWCLSTPWHPEDVNAVLKLNPEFGLFRRAVGPNLEPVWPEKWPREQLMRRRNEVGAAAFARGYHLAPVAEDEVAVRPEWVRFAEVGPRRGYERVVLAIDPAVSDKARADASALVVLGKREGDPAIDCLAAHGVRLAAPALLGFVAELDHLWAPDEILFESNAAFLGLCDLLRAHASFGSRVAGVSQSKSKSARVAALAVVIQSGAVRLAGTHAGVEPAQRALFEELTTFPFAPHDDLVDALAMGAAHLLRRPSPRVWDFGG